MLVESEDYEDNDEEEDGKGDDVNGDDLVDDYHDVLSLQVDLTRF